MATVYGKKLVNRAVAHHVDTRRAIRRETRDLEGRAKSNLVRERATTRWHKIYGPDHLTYIDSEWSRNGIDGLVSLNASNAMAIEYGHAPSGVFGPGGSLGHIDSRAPEATYILTRAAYMVYN